MQVICMLMPGQALEVCENIPYETKYALQSFQADTWPYFIDLTVLHIEAGNHRRCLCGQSGNVAAVRAYTEGYS